MDLSKLLGLGNASKEAVDEAAIQFAPVIAALAQSMAAAVSFAIQGGIDRFDGAEVTFTVKFPPPRAVAANSAPSESTLPQ